MCARCVPGAARGVCQCRGHFHGIRLLFLLLRQLAGARPGLYRYDDRAFRPGQQSQVVEVASNDGYLLQYFVAERDSRSGHRAGGQCGQWPSRRGCPTLIEFFGARLPGGWLPKAIQADLIMGNNVFAQVPDLNDFVAGLKILLKPEGVLTIEFPHLMRLMEENQFDTIYHEHFSYFCFLTAEKIFAPV